MTLNTLMLLRKRERAILYWINAVNKELSGLEISGTTGFWMSTTHVALHRLERLGLVTSRWGDESPVELTKRGGARRRYYKITEVGKQMAKV